MNFIDTLAERNAEFATHEFSPELKIIPSRKTMIIGCVDPRVDPMDILKLEAGEAVVIRNVGGRINPALLDTVAILRTVSQAAGQEMGTGWNLIVLHHTNCGIIGCFHHAPDLLATYMGVPSEGLEAMAITDPYKAVAFDVAALKANLQLPGGFMVLGLVYDVATGKIETVVGPELLRPTEVNIDEAQSTTDSTLQQGKDSTENPAFGSGAEKSGTSRRHFMGAAALTAAALVVPHDVLAATFKAPASPLRTQKENNMNTIKTTDGTSIYYKDWGTGIPIVFSHGWPLSADAWDRQMLFLGEHGYRVIAHDRRGHGRSEQTWNGNTMDTYADDLANLLETLELKGAILVGHSTGGGEVARYIGRHGTSRVAKAALISAVPPHMLKTATNPDGADISVFDGLRSAVLADRAGFFKELAMPFFGYNRPGAKPSPGIIDSFWLQGMMSGIRPSYECIKAFSETDFTGDLKKMTIPTLVIQGDDDQIVPIGIASLKTVKIAPNATLKVYKGAPHGLCTTHADQVNADLLAFIKGA